MEIKGTIIVDIPLQEGISKAGNPWKKKEWVLETVDTPYPRKVKFDFFGDRADTPIEVGRTYIVQCEPESREFNGRWYTDIHGLSVTPVDGGGFGQPQQFAPQQPQQFAQPQQPQQFAPAAPGAAQPFQAPANDFAPSNDEGDLPF